tara:strand:+ start:2003 stop:3376 length:1374 start_codon:yes stop_codon:yes gene_type:complete
MSTNRNQLDAHLTAAQQALHDDGYAIINFSDLALKNENYRVIAYKRKAVLGRGSYGNVYQAYPVDPDTGKLIREKKLAVKIYKGTRHVKESEAIFFNSYYAGCELISTQQDMYMVMAYLPGHNLMVNTKNNSSSLLNVEISQFSFAKRVDLVSNIMMAINLVHHNTPNTGNALIHGDINGSNIKMHYDEATGKIDVYIVDFGLSEKIDDDPNKMQVSDMDGTPLFMANEIVEHDRHGIKSDIYALTPVFAAIFGASNVFSFKNKMRYYEPAYYKTPYDFSGMFLDYPMPAYPLDLEVYIKKFLGRMQSEDFESRPDSDDTLRFFTTLNKLCITYAADPEDQDIYACGAKLAILADGLWRDNEFNQSANGKPERSLFPLPTPAPEHFNFDDPAILTISKSIVEAAKKSPLTAPILRKIINSEGVPASTYEFILFVRRSNISKTNENKNDKDAGVKCGM